MTRRPLSSETSRVVYAEIRQLLAQLELISHGSTYRFDPSGSRNADGPSGPPPGGLRRDEGNHEEFRRRLAGARSERALLVICDDLKAAVEGWKRTPPPSGADPEFGTFAWKRWVANSSDAPASLARRFNVSRQYIHKLRKDLRDAA